MMVDGARGRVSCSKLERLNITCQTLKPLHQSSFVALQGSQRKLTSLDVPEPTRATSAQSPRATSQDTTIADLAVGLCTGQIKTGAPCRSDRNASWNRKDGKDEERRWGVGRWLQLGRGVGWTGTPSPQRGWAASSFKGFKR